MSTPYVYDGDGAIIGSWDKMNGALSNDGPDMTVDLDGYVYDHNGNYVGHIESDGRLI